MAPPQVVGLEFDRKDIEMNKLLVTSLESRFRVYDMRTQHREEGFAFLTEKVRVAAGGETAHPHAPPSAAAAQAHKSTVWLGRHLPQNRDLFMTTGGNGGLNIYK